MPLLLKLYEAQENKYLEKYNEVVSEDYYWVKHSTGEHVPRDKLSEWLLSDEGPKTENYRIIYEGDEIGVANFFVSFEDGSRQAVLAVYIIKDGKIICSERGAASCWVWRFEGHTKVFYGMTTRFLNYPSDP